MYISIRDAILQQLAESMGEKDDLLAGLKFLNLKALEMEFFRDGTVYLLSPERKSNKINLFNSSERDLLAEQLAKNQIRISALLMHNDFSNPAVVEEVDWIVKCIAASKFFRIQTIRLDPAIHQKGLPIRQAAEKAIKILERVLAEISPTEEISFGLENHGEYSNNPEFLRIVFSALKDSRIGITLDSGNFYWYGFPLDRVYQLFTEFAPYTKHTHIKNISYPAELRQKRREMGYRYEKYVAPIYVGDIDHQRLVDSLKKVGYAGDICIEDESLGRFPMEQWPEVLKRDVGHLVGNGPLHRLGSPREN